jgi:hypothetical protein
VSQTQTEDVGALLAGPDGSRYGSDALGQRQWLSLASSGPLRLMVGSLTAGTIGLHHLFRDGRAG